MKADFALNLELPVRVLIKSDLGLLPSHLEGATGTLHDIEKMGSGQVMPRGIVTVRGDDPLREHLVAVEHLHLLREPVTDRPTSENNGGSTDYYKFAEGWKECGDIIEAREMNYNQGNIFKASFCFNIGRHEGTSYERELNKIIYFAQRELERIKNASNTNAPHTTERMQ